MLMRAEPPIFLQWVQSCFGSRLGKFTHLADRATFPLSLHYQKPGYAHLSKTPIIRIGNAAQRLHPVAGQGLNLGLRDAWALARFIQTTEPEALGSAVTRHQFEKIRHSDRTASIAFTHGLVRLFSNDWPILTQARRGALFTLACFSPARNWLAQRMMHGVYG
jgi:2-octaprenyl-6-methoxyphenol hydroxylase